MKKTMGEAMALYPSPLTPIQRETLEVAFETGYFDLPRKVTMDQLEEEFEVSHQAVSERIRRGVRALVRQELDRSTNDDVVDSTYWILQNTCNKARCYHANPHCPELLLSDSYPKGVSEEQADWYNLDACPLCLPERRQTKYPQGPAD